MMRVSKQRVTIKLTSAFTEFMRDVNQRITEGDEAATSIESDDLLQCDRVYGGLYDVAARRFGFCYFHTDDDTWDFDLDADQIAAIANRTITHLNLWQCAGGECDCLYATEDSYCTHCDSIRHFDDYESWIRIHEPDATDDKRHAMLSLQIGRASCRERV